MNKETLEMLANKLMLTMDDSEYDTLSKEFDIILKQMDLIGKIPNIKDVEPMIFPNENIDVSLREDEVLDELSIDDVLKNSGSVMYDQIKLPKIVE